MQGKIGAENDDRDKRMKVKFYEGNLGADLVVSVILSCDVFHHFVAYWRTWRVIAAAQKATSR